MNVGDKVITSMGIGVVVDPVDYDYEGTARVNVRLDEGYYSTSLFSCSVGSLKLYTNSPEMEIK